MHSGHMMPRFLMFLGFFIAVGLLSGCSNEQQNAVRQRRDNLAKLAEAYIDMHRNGSSPKNADELGSWMAESDDAITRGDARVCLAEGDVVVNWDGDLSQTEALGQFVLAFEAGVLARGGYVVMADGTVKSMTLKEFQEAAMLPTNSL